MKKPGKKTLILVVALLLVVGLVARPAWQGFRVWRAESLLEQSRQFVAVENWEEARRTAIASNLITGSVDSGRLIFESMLAERHVNTMLAGVRLFQHPEATDSDRRKVVEVALEFNDLVMAAGLLASGTESTREYPGRASQQVQLQLALGRWEEAIELVNSLDPSPGRDLLLGEGLSRSRDPEHRAETVRRLTTALEAPERDLALRTAAATAALPRDWWDEQLVTRVLEKFGKETDLPAEIGLAIASLQMARSPASRETVIAANVARYREKNLPALADWLAREEAWQRLVDLTSGGVADKTIFGHRVTALHRLQLFEELDAELAQPPVAIPDPLLLASRAAVAVQRGDPGAGVALWGQAFESAERDRQRNSYYSLALIAHQMGAFDRELEAMAFALEHPLGVPPSANQLAPLFAWLYSTGQNERLVSITYRLLLREPGNPVLINNYHYLRVLEGEDMEKSTDALRGLVDTFPEVASYRGSLALALLRGAKPEEALAVLDAVEGAPAALDSSAQAIYGAVLAALGRQAEALRLASEIRWEQLPEGEAKILRGLIGE